MIKNEYTPDSVSPPGETLADKLEEIGMSQAEFAARTGRPKKTINEIIKGKASITPETALQFERVLNIPARFWNNRERQYQQYLTRQRDRERLASCTDWLEQFSIKAMVKLGWIAEYPDKVDQVAELLNFFGLASPNQWEPVWGAVEASFRKTHAFESKQADLAAWLRQGELNAQAINCRPYNAKLFKKLLVTRGRALTRTPPDIFQPELVALCAEAGVAAAFVPQLPNAKVSGATRWLAPDKALLQLSLRYKSDDQFWFSFFHEAGHILLHKKREVFLENDKPSDKQVEEAADSFAKNILIPIDAYAVFLETVSAGHISRKDVEEFAAELGIAPGIVVGRLQHDNYLPFTHLNGLKQKFEWER